MKFVSKNVQCPKNIHIRAVAAQMQIIFQLNIFLRILFIIRTEHINLYFWSDFQMQINSFECIVTIRNHSERQKWFGNYVQNHAPIDQM